MKMNVISGSSGFVEFSKGYGNVLFHEEDGGGELREGNCNE